MSKRNPPPFRVDMNYKEWKAAIDVWSEVNHEGQGVQASLVLLAVEHPKARSMLLKLPREDRSTIEQIFTAMDRLYKNEVDPVGELFKKYRSFDRIERKKKRFTSTSIAILRYTMNWSMSTNLNFQIPSYHTNCLREQTWIATHSE